MKLCPNCHRCYEDADAACLEDQTTLVAARTGTRLLAGKYRLERMLGSGEKGTAYEATDVEIDSPVVAIDLHQTRIITDPQELEHFHREIRAASRAGGQEVADIYDYGSLPDGGAYVVMEMVKRAAPQKAIIPDAASPEKLVAGTLPAAQPEEHRLSSSNAADDESETIVADEETETKEDLRNDLTGMWRPLSAEDYSRVTGDQAPQAQATHQVPVQVPVATSTPSMASASSAPITVNIHDKRPPRRRNPLLAYAGLAAVLFALAFAATRLALRNTPEAASNSPAASTTSQAETDSANETTRPAALVPPVSSSGASSAAGENGSVEVRGRRRTQTPRMVLNQTLSAWFAATTARDIDWQMSLYMPTLTNFYDKRNVTQDFVRAEKIRLFAEEEAMDVQQEGEPQITFTDGGRVAIMRFRKSYLIKGVEHSGSRREVRQELRWRKTDEGWKIFSERNL